MGIDEFNAGGNPAIDWHPIQGTETGISSGLMGHLARMQTLPLNYWDHLRFGDHLQACTDPLLLIFQTFFFLAIIIAVWVIGITVQEIKHVLQQGKERYLLAWWHLAVIPMIMCYIISAVLWIVGYAFIALESGHGPCYWAPLHSPHTTSWSCLTVSTPSQWF